MEVRKAAENDIPRIMDIFEYARHFMAEHGNESQWGPRKWPPEWLIRSDIEKGIGYVVTNDDKPVGYFAYLFGKDIEPTYNVIEGGAWLSDSPYGVIHRLGGDGSVKGIGEACINWCAEQSAHLRADTHRNNIVLQDLLTKCGFTYTGIIYIDLEGYDNSRMAYERL